MVKGTVLTGILVRHSIFMALRAAEQQQEQAKYQKYLVF
jgi:hypothetical protein